MDFPSGPWTGFYNYGRSTRKHRMDLVLTFADRIVSGDGSDDIGRFVVTERFDGTKVNVTGPKLTSADTTFTIVAFEMARGSGGYGNCRASRAVFTSGRSARKKETKITKARKSQRQWKQSRWIPECEFLLIRRRRE
jgi:hypothetical protein